MSFGSSENLARLLYVSRNIIPNQGSGYKTEINDILTVAQRQNAVLGVTGLLTFNHGFFAQVLEGDPDTVEELFETIQMDPRHDDITILEVTEVEERAFSEWHMGFVGSDKDLDDFFRQMVLEDRTTLGAEDASTILANMEALARRHEVELRAA